MKISAFGLVHISVNDNPGIWWEVHNKGIFTFYAVPFTPFDKPQDVYERIATSKPHTDKEVVYAVHRMLGGYILTAGEKKSIQDFIAKVRKA